MFYGDFRYFLAEVKELEQKSDSEVEKGMQMLSRSDLCALEGAFLELQKSTWHALNNYRKLTSRAFQKYIIGHTFLEMKAQNWRSTPATSLFLASSAHRGSTGVQCPKGGGARNCDL